MLIGTLVQFSAVDQSEDVIHTWYVGADTLEGESILRSFPYPQIQRPLTFTVTHVIEFPEDETCYPGVTSDTVTHAFYVIEYYEETKVLNQWMRLAQESSTDSIDFIFRYLLDDGSLAPYGYTGSKSVDLYLINFFSSGDTTIIPRGEVGVIDHSLFFRNSIGGLDGDLLIEESDRISFNYSTNQGAVSLRGRLIN
ncbi:hypothetical protein [Phaeocystidibacter luteus]|uniref:Uncharacterized protein n=1 Tax=Phaeocystidibacter luteus TaxID=911197 RepID=A0A6N6RIW6_9FLAO|nr:hypothetical protein [Phaeocystidibacter luteus]KAB2814280.1 hypothetical protein F8C67_00690 [Phaeocystidibacter luteus]